MKSKSSGTLCRCIGLGLVAGMRCASAGVIALHIIRKAGTQHNDNKLATFVQSNGFNTALNIMAIGELIGDKLPFVPARIKPAGLMARIISGGVSNAAVSKATGKSVILYGLLGSAVAVGATYTFYNLRKTAGNKTGIADPLIALAEDALVASIGLALVKTSRTSE